MRGRPMSAFGGNSGHNRLGDPQRPGVMGGLQLAFRLSLSVGEAPSKDATMNRRDMLSLSATAALGLIFSPTRIFAQMQTPEPEMSALSAYMSAAGNRALPAEAAEQAKHHLLDTLASMISGSDLPPGQAALRYISSHAGKGAATIVGSALTTGFMMTLAANSSSAWTSARMISGLVICKRPIPMLHLTSRSMVR